MFTDSPPEEDVVRSGRVRFVSCLQSCVMLEHFSVHFERVDMFLLGRGASRPTLLLVPCPQCQQEKRSGSKPRGSRFSGFIPLKSLVLSLYTLSAGVIPRRPRDPATAFHWLRSRLPFTPPSGLPSPSSADLEAASARAAAGGGGRGADAGGGCAAAFSTSASSAPAPFGRSFENLVVWPSSSVLLFLRSRFFTSVHLELVENDEARNRAGLEPCLCFPSRSVL